MIGREDQKPQPVAALTEYLLRGGGEMGQRILSFDWSQTPLGPLETWPQSLNTALGICLNARFPIMIWWGEDHIRLYNDAYIPTLGSRHPSALGKPEWEVWPEMWDQVGPVLKSVLHDGRAIWSDDLRLTLERDGHDEDAYFTFSHSPILSETGKVGGIFTAVTETTDRVLNERWLRTSRVLSERLTDVQTEADICQIVVTTLTEHDADVPFALLYLSESRGGARLAAASGVEPGTSASPERIEYAKATRAKRWPFATVAQTQKAVRVEDLARLVGKESGLLTNQALILPINRAGVKEMLGFFVVGIHPHRPLDDAYEAFLERVAILVKTAILKARAYQAEYERAEVLAAVDRAKTELFSNVSHEFRAPLMLLLSPIEDLLAGQSLPEAAREQLLLAHRNARILLRQVNALLDFSQLESGSIEASFAAVDLRQLTRDIASPFRSAIEREGLRFTIDCRPLAEMVYVDRDLWEKIIYTLLSNALKYTFEGEIIVRLRQRGRQAILEVIDSGVGISPDAQPHIFKRFSHAHGGRARSIEGSGTGLALARALVREHGGDITLSSAPGKGSTFTVALPLGKEHLDPARIGAPRESSSTTVASLMELTQWDHAQDVTSPSPRFARSEPAPARIVLADDNADMREYIAQLLREQWEVIAVSDGESALEIIREVQPDLVLSDVVMPRLDGFQLLRALREDPATRTIPVILLSARADEESIGAGLMVGADDYLIKPFSSRELIARISAHLAIARIRDEAQVQVLQALDAQRESEVRFHRLYAANAIGIFSGELATILDANDAFLAIIGYSRGDLMSGGLHWAAITPPEYEDADAAATEELRETGIISIYEKEYIRKDGTRVPVALGAASLDDAGNRWIAFALDITDRKQVERERAEHLERERHFAHRQQLLADASLAINAATTLSETMQIVTNEAQVIIGAHQAVSSMTINEAWAQNIAAVALSEKYSTWLDYDERTTGEGIYALVCRENRPMRLTQVELEAHPAWHNFGQSHDKHPPMRGWLAVPLIAHDGRNLGLIQLSDKFQGDFTDEDEAVLVQLAQLASVAVENAMLFEQVNSAVVARDNLLSLVSHDLKNPLTVIKASGQVIRSRLSTHPQALERTDELLRRIDRTTTKMTGQINELLDLARMQNGQHIELDCREIDLIAMTQLVVDEQRQAARHHHLRFNHDDETLPALVDPGRIERTLINLLTNAVKYSPNGGEVVIAIEAVTREDIPCARISVSDQGIGIPASDLPHIFERYHRASNVGSIEGTGIGLSGVYEVLRLHGGEIGVESAAGKGTTFTMMVPLNGESC